MTTLFRTFDRTAAAVICAALAATLAAPAFARPGIASRTVTREPGSVQVTTTGVNGRSLTRDTTRTGADKTSTLTDGKGTTVDRSVTRSDGVKTVTDTGPNGNSVSHSKPIFGE